MTKEINWCCEGCYIKWELIDIKKSDGIREKPKCPECNGILYVKTLNATKINMEELTWYEELNLDVEGEN